MCINPWSAKHGIAVLIRFISTDIENEISAQTSRFTKYLVANETNMSNFHPLEGVGRGSETQIQEGENLHYSI